MGKRVAVAILVVAIASIATLGAQKLELDGPVDFSLTLRELSRAANDESRRSADFDSYVVLEGYISATSVTARTDDNFRASLDLVSGEWEDLEEVHTHHGRFLVEGDEYRDRIHERPPRAPAPDDIIPGRRVVVIARLLHFGDDPLSDRRIPVFEAHALRITE